MARPTTPEEALEAAALSPASMSVDGTTVVSQDIEDLLKVANRAAANNAAASNGAFGIRFVQLISPGANR